MNVDALLARAEAMGLVGRALEEFFLATLGHVGFRSLDEERAFAAALDAREARRGRWTKRAINQPAARAAKECS